MLLSTGQGIRTVGYDPIWHVAARSASPKLFSMRGAGLRCSPIREIDCGSTMSMRDIALPQSCDSTLRASIHAVVRLLVLGVARQWTVGELAREAGLSTRSLQRRLGEAELSFSRLVRLIRIHEACRRPCQRPRCRQHTGARVSTRPDALCPGSVVSRPPARIPISNPGGRSCLWRGRLPCWRRPRRRRPGILRTE